MPSLGSENGSLPFKVSFFFEGEEESGSPSLIPFMEKYKKEILSDIVLICDTGLFDNKVPAIVTRLRGILKEEIEITGPDKDLHSGLYGGVAANPAKALVNVLFCLLCMMKMGQLQYQIFMRVLKSYLKTSKINGEV